MTTVYQYTAVRDNADVSAHCILASLWECYALDLINYSCSYLIRTIWILCWTLSVRCGVFRIFTHSDFYVLLYQSVRQKF